jgi:WD40 repeat protein
LETQEVLYELTAHTGRSGSVFSPDGRTLATLSGLHLWDLASLSVRQALDTHPWCATWMPDGSNLVLGYWKTGWIRCFGVETGRETLRLNVPNKSVGISSDGVYLSAVGGEHLYFVNLHTERRIGPISAPTAGPNDRAAELLLAVWLPGTRQLVTCDQFFRLMVWDGESGELLKTIDVRDGMGYGHEMAAAPDGKHLAIGIGNGLEIWNIETGKRSATVDTEFESAVQPLIWSPDGRRLVCRTSDDRVHFCNVSSGRVTKTHRSLPCPRYPRFSPDLRLVAVPHGRCATRLCQSENGDTICVLLGLATGRGIAISPEGHYRASPRADREIVYVIQSADGQQTLPPDEFVKKYPWHNDPAKVVIGWRE